MRLATYNVEWFDALFDDTGRLVEDAGWSARHNVTRAQQIAALGHVFQRLDADAIMVIEAPDSSRKRATPRALGAFAQRFGLRARTTAMGFANDTQQEIALLYDPKVLQVRHDPQASPDAPRFDGQFEIDLDVDATLDHVRFSKPPLELEVVAQGRTLRLIGAHLKSKAPHGARSEQDALRLAIANRRKQLAQAIWLRRRIATHLAAGDSLIVMGDLNDGPGLDAFEALFGRSSVEVVLGEAEEGPALYDPHANRALLRRIGGHPTTARFYLKHEARFLQALLDYILVSPDLLAQTPVWRIWHPFDDPECWQDDALRHALLTASDHFPVTLDLP